jgi:hypothetical protein
MPVTSNIGLNLPPIGSNNWGGPLNFNFSLIDRLLSGNQAIQNLFIAQNLTVDGLITAGGFIGLDGGQFLLSTMFNQPNGIPKLNAAGLIPASLLASVGLVVVGFSATPVFNATNAQGFKMTLTGNVTSSTFANGTQGPALIMFRFLQDATGGWTFAWPSNVRNGGVVNPGPNARSVQIFALDTDGSLDAVGPIQYS